MYCRNKTAYSLAGQIAVKIGNLLLVKANSIADRIAIILRGRILSVKEATYIGSEAYATAEAGVGLPKLRQTARMLEFEELLRMKL